MSDPRRRLGQVLAGQPFPAARWELIVGADLYGADALTMSELHALPAVRFGSLADVLKAVERARHDALDGERGRRSALGIRLRAGRPHISVIAGPANGIDTAVHQRARG